MSTKDLHANVTLDMRGLTCPAPLLGAKRVVDDLKNEQIMLLISDCPGTKDDLFSWAEQTHNKVLKTEAMPDGGTGYYVMKGKGASHTGQCDTGYTRRALPGTHSGSQEAAEWNEITRDPQTCQQLPRHTLRHRRLGGNDRSKDRQHGRGESRRV